MHIILEIRENEIELLLKDQNVLIDKSGWKGKLDLSEKLLIGIDDFLTKNSLEVENIEKIVVKSNISDNLTTVRIVETVAEAFNYHGSLE